MDLNNKDKVAYKIAYKRASKALTAELRERTCLVCSKEFKSRLSKQYHQYILQHFSENDYSCPRC